MVFLFGAAWAQAPTLSAYMDAAVAHNPRTAITRADELTARADTLEAGAALLPTLNATGSWTYNQYEATVLFPDGEGGFDEIVITPRQQVDARLTLRVPLIDAPGIARWQGFQDSAEAAEADGRAALGALRLDVGRAWFTLIAAQQVLAAAERARTVAEENRRYLAARAEQGVTTTLSVQRAELEIANAERVVLESQKASAIARRTLATLSGLPEPEGALADPAIVGPADTEQALLEGAESRRPELAAARLRAEQARLARTGAALGWAPTLAATATEQYTNASGFSEQDTSWAVGAQLDWLLIDFGDRSADAQRARAAEARANALLTQTQDAVRDEIHTAWLEVEGAGAKVSTTERGAAVARATTDELQARFRAGTASHLEVIQAERDALEAEVSRVRAVGELAVARLVLQRAAGVAIGP